MSYQILREAFAEVLKDAFGEQPTSIAKAVKELVPHVTALISKYVVDAERTKYEEGRQAGYEEAKRDMLRVLNERTKLVEPVRVIAPNEHGELFCPKSVDGQHTFAVVKHVDKAIPDRMVGQCFDCGAEAP